MNKSIRITVTHSKFASEHVANLAMFRQTALFDDGLQLRQGLTSRYCPRTLPTVFDIEGLRLLVFYYELNSPNSDLLRYAKNAFKDINKHHSAQALSLIILVNGHIRPTGATGIGYLGSFRSFSGRISNEMEPTDNV